MFLTYLTDYNINSIHDEILSLNLSCQVTPLHMAAERGHWSVVEYLVDKGAKMDAKENTGVSIQIQFCYFVWSFA